MIVCLESVIYGVFVICAQTKGCWKRIPNSKLKTDTAQLK